MYKEDKLEKVTEVREQNLDKSSNNFYFDLLEISWNLLKNINIKQRYSIFKLLVSDKTYTWL